MPKRRGCCSLTPVIGAVVVGVTLCVIALAFAPQEPSAANLTIPPPTFTITPLPTEISVVVAPMPTGFRVAMPVVLAMPSPTPVVIVATAPPTPAPPTATPAPLPTVAPTAAPMRAVDPVVVPAAPNAFSCAGGCAIAPDPSCAIKGNVNSDGERIYHEPGGRSYARTDIKPEEGDRWFCTAAEALTAGFRAPEND